MARKKVVTKKIITPVGRGFSKNLFDFELEVRTETYEDSDVFLPGTASRRGEYDSYNPFTYLVDKMKKIEGYKERFKKGNFFILTLVVDPTQTTFKGIDLTSLRGATNPKARTRAANKARELINKGKLRSGGKALNLQHVELLMTVFEDLFSEKSASRSRQLFMEDARRSYQQYVLQAMNIPDSLRRGGSGGGGIRPFVDDQEEVNPKTGRIKRRKKRGKDFWRGMNIAGASITEPWQRVVKILRQPPQAKTIQFGTKMVYSLAGPSFKGLLNVKIPNTRSRFNSVYLMAEFGTGIQAAFPRPFKSETATPHKIRPQWTSILDAPTTAWISRWSAIRYMKRFQHNYYNLLNSGKGEKAGAIAQRVSHFALGKNKITSIEPHKMLFDKRGVVKQVRDGYKQWIKYMVTAVEGHIYTHLLTLSRFAKSAETKKLAEELVKALPRKGFLKFDLPDSIFDVVSYKEFLDES